MVFLLQMLCCKSSKIFENQQAVFINALHHVMNFALTINDVFSICLGVSLDATACLNLVSTTVKIVYYHTYNHVYDDKTSDKQK